MLEIEVARIDPNPDQPRREFEPAALQQLADSAELRQRLGQAGRARVAQCFSYPEFSARAKELFRRIERPLAG